MSFDSMASMIINSLNTVQTQIENLVKDIAAAAAGSASTSALDATKTWGYDTATGEWVEVTSENYDQFDTVYWSEGGSWYSAQKSTGTDATGWDEGDYTAGKAAGAVTAPDVAAASTVNVQGQDLDIQGPGAAYAINFVMEKLNTEAESVVMPGSKAMSMRKGIARLSSTQ